MTNTKRIASDKAAAILGDSRGVEGNIPGPAEPVGVIKSKSVKTHKKGQKQTGKKSSICDCSAELLNLRTECAPGPRVANNRKEKIMTPGAPLTGAEILTSRPEGMSYEDYKRLRKQQNKGIKAYTRGEGRLVFCAAQLLDVIPNPNYDPDRELTDPKDIERGYANDNPPSITVPHDPKRKDRIRVIKETTKQGYTKQPRKISAEAVEALQAERDKYFDNNAHKTE